jgi:hypothetical protein
MTRPSAGRALLLLPTRLGGIVLGEQPEAHRLRAFVFNFEIAHQRGWNMPHLPPRVILIGVIRDQKIYFRANCNWRMS